jgi:hypothetical protein
MQSFTVHRRWIHCLVILIVIGLLQISCAEYTYYPVVVEDVEMSPVYQLDVINKTSQTLTFLPIRKFRSDYDPKVVAYGQHISCLVQVNKIRVGETYSREVVAGPYLESGRLGPDRAYLQYQDARSIKREVVVDIASGEWFAPYKVKGSTGEAKPQTITITLTDDNLSKTKWFAGGPNSP